MIDREIPELDYDPEPWTDVKDWIVTMGHPGNRPDSKWEVRCSDLEIQAITEALIECATWQGRKINHIGAKEVKP